MSVHSPEFWHWEVLHALSDDTKAICLCQTGVYGGESRQSDVSGGPHAWTALSYVPEGELAVSPAVVSSRYYGVIPIILNLSCQVNIQLVYDVPAKVLPFKI